VRNAFLIWNNVALRSKIESMQQMIAEKDLFIAHLKHKLHLKNVPQCDTTCERKQELEVCVRNFRLLLLKNEIFNFPNRDEVEPFPVPKQKRIDLIDLVNSMSVETDRFM
jgi:hypothetical protein